MIDLSWKRGKKQIHVRITEEMHMKLSSLIKSSSVTTADIVRGILYDFFKNNEVEVSDEFINMLENKWV